MEEHPTTNPGAPLAKGPLHSGCVLVYNCNHGANVLKKAVTWRFEESDLEAWKVLAEKDGRSLNNWVERALTIVCANAAVLGQVKVGDAVNVDLTRLTSMQSPMKVVGIAVPKPDKHKGERLVAGTRFCDDDCWCKR